jgi:hypothetical protein
MGHDWVMNSDQIVEKCRAEVDTFVEEIRLKRGTDADVVFASREENERRNEAIKLIAVKARRRCEELCDYVNEVALIFDHGYTVSRIFREFDRIPNAIQGN